MSGRGVNGGVNGDCGSDARDGSLAPSCCILGERPLFHPGGASRDAGWIPPDPPDPGWIPPDPAPPNPSKWDRGRDPSRRDAKRDGGPLLGSACAADCAPAAISDGGDRASVVGSGAADGAAASAGAAPDSTTPTASHHPAQPKRVGGRDETADGEEAVNERLVEVSADARWEDRLDSKAMRWAREAV